MSKSTSWKVVVMEVSLLFESNRQSVYRTCSDHSESGHSTQCTYDRPVMDAIPRVLMLYPSELTSNLLSSENHLPPCLLDRFLLDLKVADSVCLYSKVLRLLIFENTPSDCRSVRTGAVSLMRTNSTSLHPC
jgi:hypothetical protein